MLPTALLVVLALVVLVAMALFGRASLKGGRMLSGFMDRELRQGRPALGAGREDKA